MLKKDSFVPGRHAALLPAILLFACFLTGCGGPSILRDSWRSKGAKKIKSYSGRPNASLYIREIDKSREHQPPAHLTLLIDGKKVDHMYCVQFTPYIYPLMLKTGTHNVMLQTEWDGKVYNPTYSGMDVEPKITPIVKFSVALKEDEVWLLSIWESYYKGVGHVCKKIGDRGKFTYHPDAKYHEDPYLNRCFKDIFKHESTKKKGRP